MSDELQFVDVDERGPVYLRAGSISGYDKLKFVGHPQ